jgi:hypothetical protein
MKHAWPMITDPKAIKIICLTFVRLIVKHLRFLITDPNASKFICLGFVKTFNLTPI